MEIAKYIKTFAEELLKKGDMTLLPAQLAGTEFYLAAANDDSILAHGAVKSADGVEYKIGTKK